MTSRSLLLGSALASILVASVSDARADAMADAKDLFTRGRELRTRGDCGHAVDLFRKAYELYPAALGSLRNLAECDESLGRFASARRAWVDLKRALLTTSDDHKYDGWAQDADQAATRLAPKLATLTIDVNVVASGGEAAPAEGVDVTLDGEKLAPALVGTPLERDPGRHVVRVTGERVPQATERAVDLAPGDARRVALRVVVEDAKPLGMEPAVTSPSGSPPVKQDVRPPETAGSPRRTVAWVALGVGVAALAGAGVSLAVRQSALDDLNGACAWHVMCDPSLRSTADRGHTASALFNVLGIAGAAGVAVGVLLLVTGPAQPSHARLTVTPTLGGVSAAVRF